jgi:hypothetical protein
VSYGSYNTANAEVAGSAIVNDNVKIGMSYNHGQSSGYNLTPAQYQNVNLVPTASKADNVAASVFLTPSDKLKVFAKAYLTRPTRTGWSGPSPTTTGRPIACCWAAATRSTTSPRSTPAAGRSAARSAPSTWRAAPIR